MQHLLRAIAIDSEELPPERIADARNQVEQLAHVLARLEQRVEPDVAGTLVELDGAPVPAASNGLWLEPGTHTLRVAAAGYMSVERSVVLVEGRTEQLAISLMPVASQSTPAPVLNPVRPGREPAPAQLLPRDHERARAPSVTSRWWFWTAIGAGVLGAASTAILILGSPDRRPTPVDFPPGIAHFEI